MEIAAGAEINNVGSKTLSIRKISEKRTLKVEGYNICRMGQGKVILLLGDIRLFNFSDDVGAKGQE